MKHLLSGVALAAIVALAAPVWAQAPATPASPNAPAGDQPATSPPPAATAPPAPTSPPRPRRRLRPPQRRRSRPPAESLGRKRPKRLVRRYYGGSASDHVANQLNAAELGRMGTPAPAYPARLTLRRRPIRRRPGAIRGPILMLPRGVIRRPGDTRGPTEPIPASLQARLGGWDRPVRRPAAPGGEAAYIARSVRSAHAEPQHHARLIIRARRVIIPVTVIPGVLVAMLTPFVFAPLVFAPFMTAPAGTAPPAVLRLRRGRGQPEGDNANHTQKNGNSTHLFLHPSRRASVA